MTNPQPIATIVYEMAPDSTSENAECLEDDKQYLFIVRHGDRWDYSNPEVRTSDRRTSSLFLLFNFYSHTLLLLC